MKYIFIILLLSISLAVNATETVKTVGENTYRWTNESFSLNEVLVFKSSKNETKKCQEEEQARLRGFVGNMITLNIFGSRYCEGMAHFNHWETVKTFRVIDGEAEKVTLLDFFSQDELVSVLSNDSFIKNKYSGNIRKSVRNALLNKGPELCEEVTSDTLGHFAFHHLHEDKVAIRLFLQKCNSSSRSLQLGFNISPNKHLLSILKNSEKNNLLMHNFDTH